MKRLLFIFGLIAITGLLSAQEAFVLTKAEKEEAIAKQKALEQQYNVKRGERPYFDLRKVPENLYYKGKLQIKLKPYMHKHMDKELQIADKDLGYVKTGYAPLDAINKTIGAEEYLRRQDALYRVSPVSEQYRERHEAWGGHLWREITFDSKMNVVEVVEMFQQLEEIEIAEPIFIKRRILPVETSPILNPDGTKWTPNDPLYAANQWHYNNTGQDIGGQVGTVGWDCNAEAAWDIETGNPNFIVAIIDGGVDFDHVDIAANMWPTIGPDGTGTLADNHGTHVAGTIAAISNNGTGMAGLAGGSGSGDGAKIMSIDLFNGSHGLTTLGMNQYAADNGASISQNSWGYGSAGVYNQDDLDGIDYFNANGGGTGLIGGITIFAAGNDNDNADWYPAYYSEALAVASHDNTGTRSSFSNYGTWVDITAPGTNVASLEPNDTYAFMSGTSMACPHVSGVAAMIVSNTEGVLTNAELRTIIEGSVRVDLYDVNPAYTGQLGQGALDAAAALTEAQTYLGGVPTPQSFSATDLSATEIELVWTLNVEGDDVLIAWAEGANPIGTPTDGTTYSIGNTLPGGGEVLYVGNALTMTHTGLNATTTYNYKIFAIAGADRQDSQGEWYQQGDYSKSRSSSATTPCGVYAPPFSDSFEDGTMNPCWYIEYVAGSTAWGIVDDAATAQDGSRYVEFNATTTAQTTRLITPALNLQGYTGATLDFFEIRNRGGGQVDELSIEYWDGSAWQPITSYTTEAASWTNRNIALPAGALHSESQIAFKAIASSRAQTYTRIDNVSITVVGPAPLAAAPSATPSIICEGETVQLNANATGGDGTLSYSWTSSPAGFTSGIANPTVSPTVNTTYTVNVTDEGSGDVTEFVSVTVNPLPTAPTSVSATATTIIEGQSTTLSYTGGSGTNFEWYSGTCGGTAEGTGQDLTVSPTVTTTYYGRWENSCGESVCQSIEITVIPLDPTLRISEETAAAGGTVTVPVYAKDIVNMVGFQWTISYDQTKLAFTSTSGWHDGISVTVNDDATNGNLTFTYSDVSDPLYQINISSEAVLFNINFSVDAGASGDALLTWTDSPTPRELIRLDESGGTPVNINATWTDGRVIISSVLTADFTASPTTVCQNETVTFTDASSGTSGSQTYSWDFGTGATPATAAGAGPHDVTYSTSGTKTVSLTVTDGSTDTETKADYITVNPLPGDAGTISGTTPVCQGVSGTTYSISPVSDATSYLWSYSGSGATINGTSESVTIDFSTSATSGDLTVYASNGCGDGGTSPAYSVTINPLPVAPTSVSATPSTVNSGDPVTLNVSGGSGTSFEWYTDGCGTTPAGSGDGLIVNPTATTIYYGRWETGCGVSTCESVTVTVNAPGYTVSGNLTYSGSGSPLNGETINLMDGASTVATDLTDASGNYSFSNVPDGSYTLETSIGATWGGVTADDITLYKQHIVNISLLTGLPLSSGDANNSGSLTVMDLTYILQRFFDDILVLPNGDWLLSNGDLTVSGSDVTHNLEAICYGDANTDWTSGGKSLEYLSVLQNDLLIVEEGNDFILPVDIQNDIYELASVTLNINYDAELVEITDVSSQINASDWEWRVNDGTVKILYSTLDAADISTGDVLFTLNGTAKTIPQESMVVNSISGEFADFSHNFISGVVLGMPAMANTAPTGVALLENEIEIYPNPSGYMVNITNASGAGIKIYNAFGSLIHAFRADETKESVDVSSYAGGTYFVRIERDNEIVIRKLTVLK